MNISKGKVLKNREWSVSTQKKLASMLGVSAMLSAAAALSACDLGTTSGDITGTELSSSSKDLPPESGVVEPPEPTCGDMPCDGNYPPSSSSVKQLPPSSSSDFPEYPPQAGILPPQDISSSSYAIDTLEITSGEIAPPDTLEPESGSPFDQSHDLSSSSSGPEYPPLAGVVAPEFESSSSSVDVLPSSSANEVEIDSTLTAGLPVIEESSSSAEERDIIAGDPVLPPEPLSGDVAEPDVL